MKKKDIITAIIIAIVLAAILFGAIYLASRHRLFDDNPEKIIRSYYQTDGIFLYFNKNGNMMCYNYLTDSASKICGHEDFNPECPLERLSGNIFLFNNRLYFDYRTELFGNRYVVYYDLQNGEIYDLNIELEMYNNFFISDEIIYYISENSVFSMSVNGGKATKLIECGKDEDIFAVADGKLFTCTYRSMVSSIAHSTSYIYSYDIDTLKKEEIYSFSTSISYPISRVQYFDGKIYMFLNTYSRSLDTSSYKIMNELYSLDIKKKEINKLIDLSVEDFILTENSIYYFPYEERQIYAPDVYYSDENGMYTVLKSANIHACDLDGKNDRIVYTNPDISLEVGYVIKDKIFGYFIGTAPGIESNNFYASLNLKNGEIKEVKIPS